MFAVADGVGSMPGSPIASQAAVKAVRDAAEEGLFQRRGGLALLLETVNHAVLDALSSLSDGNVRGATTLSVVAVQSGRVLIVSVGDSEVHMVGSSGDSRLQHELDHVPNRPNVLLAWIDGRTAFEPHVVSVAAESETLCLMSDGIPGALSRAEIARVVRNSHIGSAARELVLAARGAGANDDVTAVVVAVPPTSPAIR